MMPWVAAVLLIVATAVVYAPGLSAPFVLDDGPAIEDNPSIRRLSTALTTSGSDLGNTVDGRPVLNFSFAINYAISGLNPNGYHLLNLGIHLGAGLVLMDLLRRTLVARGWSAGAVPVAFASALIWMLHPLQTSAVTYVSQRAESLAGFFVLLTLYGFVRGVDAARPTRWLGVSVVACMLGMATKETAVAAPLLVLLYDFVFVSGSLRLCWVRRWRYYIGLGASWLVLISLLLASGGRGKSAGFESALSSAAYAAVQAKAIFMYLGLSFWPNRLVFDYGVVVVESWRAVWPQSLLLGVLATTSVVLVARRHAIGYLGIWFFAQLAPSSSIVPISTQTIAEHRMYLALISVVVVSMCVVRRLASRWTLVIGCGVATAFGVCTALRNQTYGNEIGLWQDTVGKAPDNVRAHGALAKALAEAGRTQEAIDAFTDGLKALEDGAVWRKDPVLHAYYDSILHGGRGIAHAFAGQTKQAMHDLERASRIEASNFDAQYNLAVLLARAGRPKEAIPRFEAVLSLRPGDEAARANLEFVRYLASRPDELAGFLREACEGDPQNTDTRLRLAEVLIENGAASEALMHLQILLRSARDRADIWALNGLALMALRDFEQAESCFVAAIALDTGDPQLRIHLGDSLVRQSRWSEARACYTVAAALAPNHPVALSRLKELDAPAANPTD